MTAGCSSPPSDGWRAPIPAACANDPDFQAEAWLPYSPDEVRALTQLEGKARQLPGTALDAIIGLISRNLYAFEGTPYERASGSLSEWDEKSWFYKFEGAMGTSRDLYEFRIDVEGPDGDIQVRAALRDAVPTAIYEASLTAVASDSRWKAIQSESLEFWGGSWSMEWVKCIRFGFDSYARYSLQGGTQPDVAVYVIWSNGSIPADGVVRQTDPQF